MTHMSLSDDEVARLLRLVQVTREEELTCDDCLDRIADFAENELRGEANTAQFEAVRQHLSVCEECHDEYDVLKRALGDAAETPNE